MAQFSLELEINTAQFRKIPFQDAAKAGLKFGDEGKLPVVSQGQCVTRPPQMRAKWKTKLQ